MSNSPKNILAGRFALFMTSCATVLNVVITYLAPDKDQKAFTMLTPIIAGGVAFLLMKAFYKVRSLEELNQDRELEKLRKILDDPLLTEDSREQVSRAYQEIRVSSIHK